MTRPDLACIDLVVVEVLARQHPGLVADQPVFRDGGGVELNLDLHVLGDGEEGRARFLDQRLPGLAERIDIGG